MGIFMHTTTNKVQLETIEKITKWIKQAFTTSYQNEIEHYLNQSVDMCDLENRLKIIARRGML